MKNLTVIALIFALSFLSTSYCIQHENINVADRGCPNRGKNTKEDCLNLKPVNETLTCCAYVSPTYIMCVALVSSDQDARKVVEDYYKGGSLVCEGESNSEEEEKNEEEKNEEIDDVNQGDELETTDDKDNIGKWYKLGAIYVVSIFILYDFAWLV